MKNHKWTNDPYGRHRKLAKSVDQLYQLLVIPRYIMADSNMQLYVLYGLCIPPIQMFKLM